MTSTLFQPHHACHDQPHRHQFDRRQAFTQQRKAEKPRAQRTDGGPDRVGDAYRQLAHGQGQEVNPADGGHHRDQRWPEPGKAFGVLHAHGEGNFEPGGDQQKQPGHQNSRASVSKRCSASASEISNVRSADSSPSAATTVMSVMPMNPSAVRSNGSAWFIVSSSPPGPKPKPPRLVTIRAFLPCTNGSYCATPLSRV